MDWDGQLIRRMKAGDDAAFESFINAHYDDVLAYCTRHCAHRDDAQNLTQDVFLLFFRHLSTYRHIGKVKPYLYTIAKHCCINYGRKQREIPIDPGVIDLVETRNGIDECIDALTIQSYVDQLSYEYAQVVELFYREDQQICAIAKELGISIPLVKYRLRQAKITLRTLLTGSNTTGDTDEHISR